jgi:glycosyltransferase involved in cell wall biosynthesis
MEKWIQKMGLTDQVKLFCLQNNPYVWIKNTAFLLDISDYRSFLTVLIEIIILGKHVICSDFPIGPKEILKNGEIGTLVKMGDTLAFANAIEDQIKNPANMQML